MHFDVGPDLRIPPLVTIQEVKGHLGLLHLFADLKRRVNGIPNLPEHLSTLKSEKRWGWFVGLAVER